MKLALRNIESLFKINLEVISTNENWNPITMIFNCETKLWIGFTDIRSNNQIKDLLSKAIIQNRN
jgi:hypothetical protein